MVNFGEKDCSDKLKAALIKDKVYFDVLLKSTTNIPSYNLNGSK